MTIHPQKLSQALYVPLSRSSTIMPLVLMCLGISTSMAAAINADQANQPHSAAADTSRSIKPPPRNIPGRPTTGMRMKQVEQQFGQPVRVKAATGKPPITRWIYPEFTVYFEGVYVIHTVKNRIIPGITDRKPSS